MNFDDIRKHQKAFLEKAKARKKPVVFNVEGIEVIVNPNVFPPATDTKLLVANIKTKNMVSKWLQSKAIFLKMSPMKNLIRYLPMVPFLKGR